MIVSTYLCCRVLSSDECPFKRTWLVPGTACTDGVPLNKYSIGSKKIWNPLYFIRGCLCARWRYRSRFVKSMLFTKCCVTELQLAVVIRITDNTAEVLPITASLIDTENGGGGLPSCIRLYLRLRGLITDKLYVSRFEVQ